MVGVGPKGSKSVLARVSIVDYNGQCIFDTFVRVEEKVTDYRTFVSGIRPQDLESPDAMDYDICRHKVQKILLHKILVGHALENDLSVLQLFHPFYNKRDTGLYPPFMKVDQFGFFHPRRLRDLARQHLGILIQQPGQEHDSVEDSNAAMLLYKQVQADWDFQMDLRRRTSVLQSPLHYLPIL
jgi:RNA exonuclease 4